MEVERIAAAREQLAMCVFVEANKQINKKCN